MNNRTHRKVLVIDGKVGFTGGVGIADVWSGHAQDPDHWRDTHFRAEGPVVAQMQAVFMDNWIKVTGEVLHGTDYFPPLEKQARAAGRCSAALRKAAAKACTSCTCSRSPPPRSPSTCRAPISFRTSSRGRR
jgi:phosphatidylserine/phosphatidylglycerophosphate/cardiolipin synthase-like enzyme